jgi:hypothetical protein
MGIVAWLLHSIGKGLCRNTIGPYLGKLWRGWKGQSVRWACPFLSPWSSVQVFGVEARVALQEVQVIGQGLRRLEIGGLDVGIGRGVGRASSWRPRRRGGKFPGTFPGPCRISPSGSRSRWNSWPRWGTNGERLVNIAASAGSAGTDGELTTCCSGGGFSSSTRVFSFGHCARPFCLMRGSALLETRPGSIVSRVQVLCHILDVGTGLVDPLPMNLMMAELQRRVTRARRHVSFSFLLEDNTKSTAAHHWKALQDETG